MNAKQVVDLFVDRKIVEPAHVEEILQEVDAKGKDIVDVLIDFQFVTEEQFYHVLGDALGTSVVDLRNYEPPVEVIRLLPGGLARLHGALPVGISEDGVQICLVDPLNPQTLEDLRFAIGRDLELVVAPPYQVEELIEEFYGSDTSSIEEILAQLGFEGEAGFGNRGTLETENFEADANATPIIRFVDLILQQAIQDQASDIHFEPFEKEFTIRYRVDGALYEMAPPPLHLALPVISRVKVMANLNIAERRLPQDGRIQKMIGSRKVDLRVSTLPTQHGESVVLRVLDRSTASLELESLGMPDYIYHYICNTVQKPNGIFLVTGPTGSGKTTTLYACLNRINTVDSKLLTAEDPVEYDIEGIQQVPIQESIGLTFSRVLRAFLRQDPDRIMVGEMRDIETAQISMQASLTGHLVFSTLHTNDAAGAVTRLIDMGVEPFMISATLEGVLAQRLIRKICRNCRTLYEPSEAVLSHLGLSPHEIGDKKFYYGKGCPACHDTGYRGRKGIYELLNITDPLRELINERAPTVALKQKAIELGMITLRQDGLRCIYEGETTIEEVLKYT